MVNRTDLTFDIWEHIAAILWDEIDPEHPENTAPLKNLAALASSCKSMVPLCQKHIFSYLLLNDDPARSARGRDIISENPGLALYVRFLEYTIYDPPSSKDDDYEILRILLNRSSVLHSIKLTGFPFGFPFSQSWNTAPSLSQTLLRQLIQLPTVTTLWLDGVIQIPSDIVARCPNITHLTLRDADFIPTNDNLDDAQPYLSPRLVSLEGSDRCYDAIRFLMGTGRKGLRFIDLSGLKKLSMSFGMEDRQLIWDLLKITSRLESLHLMALNRRAFAGLGAALSTHAILTLRRLSVLTYVVGRDQDPLGVILAELTNIAGSNVLEEISLEIKFTMDALCQADNQDWGIFDSLLTTAGSFPMLKVVSMEIVLSGGESGAVVHDRITARNFPKLLKNSTVEFEFSTSVIQLHM